jgi:hypothetical protein
MSETRSTYGEQEMPKIFSSETSFYDKASAKRSFQYIAQWVMAKYSVNLELHFSGWGKCKMVDIYQHGDET